MINYIILSVILMCFILASVEDINEDAVVLKVNKVLDKLYSHSKKEILDMVIDLVPEYTYSNGDSDITNDSSELLLAKNKK